MKERNTIKNSGWMNKADQIDVDIQSSPPE